ncbi:MAG: TonB-dependent receptor [Bacteroidales bacterium]|nr:TonB-dependent receptor [Bacteroidales bacterium]
MPFLLDAQQVATLQGRITDKSGNTLHYASVAAITLDPVRGAVTDEKGCYTLTLPADSAVRLTVRYSGYASRDTVVKLAAGKTVMDFSLSQQATQLGTVTVTDERTRTNTFTSIKMEQVENNVGPQAGVESLLKTLPDVSSNNEMSSQYSVRGGSFDENLIYINHVEVYRPMLVRNGQQEGTSIINPNMVDNIMFSPGGFDATYGDRMASVLDINYGLPYASADTSQRFFHDVQGHASASFLGASLSLKGAAGDRLAYSIGLRQHSNRYIFNSLDTKGNYTTSYTDLQAVVSYRANDNLDLQFFAIASRNIYGLVPDSQTTTFGGWQEVMQFEVYYEGQERDSYRTGLAALTADWHPSDDFRLRWTNSFQTNNEAEQYDILSQFMLYELNVGNVGENGEPERFDRGIGSFLEHARNYLTTNIYSSELHGRHYARLGNWDWGLKLQYEQVRDKMREWKWVDSAGYAMPTVLPTPGDSANAPLTPVLQQFCRANHTISTMRLYAFVQRNVDLYTDRGDLFSIVGGLRLTAYDINFTNDNTTGNASNYGHPYSFDITSLHNRELFLSPRLSLNYKPKWERDILFRLAAGIYSQAPFYREYRYDDGTLNHDIRTQHSYQAMGTMDWNLRINDKPFKFTADLYYKYVTNLITYRIDNLRIRYDANNDAVGRAAGLSLRISGEFVEGLESWASLSLMTAQQDILNDNRGWAARPTDQLISFKIFLQDYVPNIPFWRMSLNFLAGSGLPYAFPGQRYFAKGDTYPAYFRVDWGNTIQLSRFQKIKDSRLMQHIEDILVSVEIFNLFNYNNVVSYTWVADYNNQYYPVPNFLTARQLNLKLTVTF